MVRELHVEIAVSRHVLCLSFDPEPISLDAVL